MSDKTLKTPPATTKHGTYNMYNNYGCKCFSCKQSAVAWRVLHVREEQREDRRIKSSAYYHLHKREISVARKAAWREIGSKKFRSYDLMRKYGLKVEDYDAMLKQQNGGCAVCGSSSSGLSDTRALAIDHNHQTGKIRGVLCHPCNRALGLLREDEKIIMSLLKYKQKEGFF